MTKNIDKIKISLGNEVFNHISSLNKSQLEKQLSELKSELSLADKKSQRYDKLKDEEWYILYRLEKTNDFKYETGGVVRKMYSGDAVLYEGNVWYVTEKDGKLGITNLKSGAWGSKYPFVERSRIDTSKLTDMMGRKVELVESKMAKGGGVGLNEGDYVWNAVGKKLIVDKIKGNEYYLIGFGEGFAKPFSKEKIDNYIKNGEWSLKPKFSKGGGFGSSFEYTIGGL